jgi:hypothetical protein
LKSIPELQGFLTGMEHTYAGLVVITFLITNSITDYASLFVIRPSLAACGKRPILTLIGAVFIGCAFVGVGSVLRAFLSIVDFNQHPKLFFDYWRATLVMMIPAAAVFVRLPLLALGIAVIRSLVACEKNAVGN